MWSVSNACPTAMSVGVFLLAMDIDWKDLIAFVGICLIGVSVYLLAGWVGMIGYAGALLATAAVFFAGSQAGDP